MSKQLPAFQMDMKIEEIGAEGNRFLASEWRVLYESMHEQLTAAFLEIEDAAYGLFLDQLMPAVFERLEDAGFVVSEALREDDFVIGKNLIFRNSLEKWGTEDNRSRVFWNVIRNKEGQPIGTLLTDIPHSHLKFDIPSAPVLYTLRESVKEQIVQGIRQLKE
ncbi:DUF6022 family protein [Brevibacillus fortis]|uniref:Uncharacterized protein n=1 Tax=Brevibacillus fortis TaxID=2126352 RepID=A0A2P7UKC0_9BACL|nr:DUF6022 family protein [Brevibacillus fortis]PSJ87253.1 hypothetical protein C7R93_27305 [Brevibacillus fortis]